MASLQNVLAGIPGLGGYLAGQQQNQQQQAQKLAQVGALQRIAANVQAQQQAQAVARDEAQIQGVVQQAGGDPDKAITALIASGHPKAIELATKMKGLRPEPAKPQLVTVDVGGKPMQQWVRPGETSGVEIGQKYEKPNITQPSSLGKLIAERDALPEGDPRRALYDRAVASASKNAGGGVNISLGGINLGKAGQNKVDEGILDTSAGLMRLSAIENQFKPEYQQFVPRLSASWTALKDKAGVGASPQETKFLAEFSSYKRNAIDSMNAYIKSITGAAMSEPEAQRILKGMPSAGQGLFDGDSPIEFKSKMDDAIRQTKRALARYTYIKQRGLQIGDIPLDKMPQVMNDRGKELEAQIKQQSPGVNPANLSKLVRGMLAKEFGLIQ